MKKNIFLILIVLVPLVVLVLKDTSIGHMTTNIVKGLVSFGSSVPIYIETAGDSIVTRILLPEGYHRAEYPKDSFQEYLRNYKLKKYGTPIINYDDTIYFAQHWHDAVLEIPVPANGLQQCADALMRIRAEYLWNQNRKDEIGFNFTSGHYCSWKKYAEGYRPKVNGNQVAFYKKAIPDNSKSNFYKYLNLIYTYAGTLSLYMELPEIPINDLRIGDMLLKPGSPGHVEMIVDEIVNEQGEKMFLLVQGNTPAQSVCLLKNFENARISPWYKFKENQPVYTPSYYFEEALFIRFK